MTILEYKELGAELNELLGLRFSPIAFKLIKNEDEIIDGYIRPHADMGGRIAACQAFALVRRDRKSIAMTGIDNACVWPMIGYGMTPMKKDEYEAVGKELFGEKLDLEYRLFIADQDKAKAYFEKEFPVIDGDNCGFMLAPLEETGFVPDCVMIYAKPAQLRNAIMAYKFIYGKSIDSKFDSVESCLFSTVASIGADDVKITVPDPGEYKRAYCDEDELIFTIPASKLAEVVGGLKTLAGFGLSYKGLNRDIEPMPNGGFYKTLLDKWGMGDKN